MIRVLVMYPRTEGSHFDADYWTSTHMPLITEHWPQAVKWEADVAGDDAAYYGAAHIFFESAEDFMAAAGGPGGPVVMGDVPNYTDVQPSLTIFQVHSSS